MWIWDAGRRGLGVFENPQNVNGGVHNGVWGVGMGFVISGLRA